MDKADKLRFHARFAFNDIVKKGYDEDEVIIEFLGIALTMLSFKVGPEGMTKFFMDSLEKIPNAIKDNKKDG